MTDTNGFSVDPRIFRQLGALLVKRDSIALIELLKNAYDADATEVHVVGQHLDDPKSGSIIVRDDGVGMTKRQFTDGFLRIASDGKERGDRRSKRFGRRYTGEKGIGRLSAHKLGSVLDVQTVAMSDLKAGTGATTVRARIDWQRMERYRSLTDLGPDALRIESTRGKRVSAGTIIRLTDLRDAWGDTELERFVAEADLFEPPATLLGSVTDLVGEKLLFSKPKLRDANSKNSRFSVVLEGDFEVGEALWQDIPSGAWWVIEIDARRDGVRYAIAPTPLAFEKYPDVDVVRNEIVGADPSRPRFQARIFAREGVKDPAGRPFTAQVSGVRVYMEGFRISPYGDPGDDWLGLDADYSRRTAKLNLDIPNLRAQTGLDREGLRTLANPAYVGAVLLTHRGAKELAAPVDREGFLPSPQFDSLQKTVRVGIDLLTRTRALHFDAGAGQSAGKKRLKREARQAMLADEITVRDGLAASINTARELRATAAAGAFDFSLADEFIDELAELSEAAERTVGDRALLRVLASAGTQMAAFVHEIQNVVAATSTLDATLGRLIDEHPEAAPGLRRVRGNLATVRQQVGRQANYLTDVATVEARRRRSKQPIAERLDRAWDLLEPSAERQGITFENRADDRSRSTAMFPAEISTVFTNLMTNAIKAAGIDGTITASSGQDDNGVWFRLSNTGRAVDPADGERWFLPFESTTLERIDPLLGQGMGLGLPITRSILGDYHALIRFVKPDAGMATTIEVRFR